ncbi:MAG: SpaA isopeptide-forming pilin-related protein [Sporolactobacillus sp.]
MRSTRLSPKKKHKKSWRLYKRILTAGLLILFCFSQTSVLPFLQGVIGHAETASTAELIDGVTLTTGTPAAGTAVSAEHPLVAGETVNLVYSWSEKTAGQSASMQPITFKIPTNFTVNDAVTVAYVNANSDVKTSSGQTVGKLSVTSSDAAQQANTVTLTFNSNADGNLSGASGKIIIPVLFGDTVQAGQTSESIAFDIGDGQSQTVDVAVQAPSSAVSPSAASSTAAGGSAAQASTQSAATGSTASSTVTNRLAGVRMLAAQASTPQPITQNILTGVTLTDANGNPWTSSNRPGVNSPAIINFTWAIPDDMTVNDGDYYEFDLPDQFAIYNTISGELDGNAGSVGTYTITPGTDKVGHVKMVFNAFSSNHSLVNGTLGVSTQFNSQTITGSTQQQITFPINSPVTLTIPFKPSQTMDAIDKQGTPYSGNTQTDFNATSIQWTVNVNETENTLTNAKVTDPTPAGLTLDTGSVKIYPVTVNVDGTTSVGTTPIDSSQYTLHTADGNLEVDFNNPITGAYQIAYTTDITNKTASSFSNTATLSSDGNSDQPATNSVTLTHGAHLTKSSTNYDAASQTTTWTINYNGDMQTLSDAILNDAFDASQVLDGSVKVYNATATSATTFSQGALVDPSNYTETPTSVGTTGTNGFALQFNNTINSAYQIVYQTQPNPDVNDGLVSQNTTINNTVTEGSTASQTAQQTISQQNLIKGWNSADYANKTTTWKMTVNNDHYEMKDAYITDTFDNGGLTLNPGMFNVSDKTSGKTLVNGIDYTLTPAAGGFTLVFLDGSATGGTGNYTDTSDSFTIMYTTAFDYTQLNAGKTIFSNTASITFTDKNNKSQSSTSNATFDPGSYTQNDGYKNGSYNAVTKEITWTVGFNYNLKTIQTPIIKDPILGNQQFENGTLEVHYMNLSGDQNGTSDGGVVPAADYSVSDPSGANNNTLTVTLNGPISSAYYITYKTSLAGQVIHSTYSNTATLYDNTTSLATLSASVSPASGDTFATKSGVQNDTDVDWTVTVNPSQSTVNDAVLTDNPTNNQIIDPSSFHLYTTSVDSSGNISQASTELTQGTDYTLDVTDPDANGNQQFTIVFAHQINAAYILKYSTVINAGNNASLGNTATLSGNNVQTINQPTSTSVTVKYSAGWGTGSGVNGSLDVKKVDADNSTQGLAGATFQLYDSTGTKLLRTVTTDQYGMADFNNFKYGTYVLKESTPPAGYVLNPAYAAGQTVTIGSTDMSQTNPVTNVTVPDQKFVGRAVLTKTDATLLGLKLGGAVYQLQDQNGHPVSGYTPQTTDSISGQVTFDNLQPGNYQLVETTAPTNYQLDPTPHTFTVATNQTTEIDLNATDTIQPGGVTLDKVDGSGHMISASPATFTLTDNSTGQPAVDADGQPIPAGALTTSSGKIVLTNLRPGSYTFNETAAPSGYLINSTPLTVSVIAGQQAGSNLYSFTDYQGTAQLTKVNVLSAGLPGAQFKVVNTDSSTTIQTNLTSDGGGTVRASGLAPGHYAFVETAAPSGYLINSTPMPFTISVSAAGVPVTANAGQLTDYQGSVQFTKTDAAGHPLAGATFQITDLSGALIQQGLTSQADGTVSASGLTPGTYYFTETSAPQGFIANTNAMRFTIASSAQGAPAPVVLSQAFINYKGACQLTKTDANGKALAGATYELQEQNGGGAWLTVLDGLQTDSAGTISVGDLAVGSYRFLETAAPSGYLLNNAPVPLTINPAAGGQPAVIAVLQQDQLNQVTLTKVDVNDNSIHLPGAVFSLCQLDGSGNKTPVTAGALGQPLSSSWTTDASGQFTVSGLAPGNYAFAETQAPSGYDLDATPIPFTVTATQTAAQALTASDGENAVTLTKVDVNDGSIHLPGAVFNLYQLDGNGNKTAVTTDALGHTLSGSWTTDAGGQFTVSRLAPGSYIFVESQAPNGYDLDATPIPFTVTATQTAAQALTASDGENAVTLTKVDANDNNIHLPGAVFNLYLLDGSGNKTPVTTDALGQSLSSHWTTDAGGQFTVSRLAPGNYIFVEAQAPAGYLLDATPIPFTITATQTATQMLSATDNENSVSLTKIDSNDNTIHLQGAVFSLYQLDGSGNNTPVTAGALGQPLSSSWTTDASGQFTVSGLAPGSYAFVETQAPSGYNLDATPIPFIITATQTAAQTLSADDKLTPGAVTLTKVDAANHGKALQGAVFKLQDAAGNPVVTNAYGGALPASWTTDASGRFTVGGLAPGSYQFVEIQAPSGYDVNSTPILFTISKAQQTATAVTAYDQQHVIVLKGEPGTVYNVVDGDGHVILRGVMAYSNGDVVLRGLAPGSYHLVRAVAAILPGTGDAADSPVIAGAGALLLIGGALLAMRKKRRNNG